MLLYSTNGDIPFFLFKMFAKVVMGHLIFMTKRELALFIIILLPFLVVIILLLK